MISRKSIAPADLPDGLGARGRALENAFFLREDMKLIERQRELGKLRETRKNLARVSGIRDEKALDHLMALKIRPETLASLVLVPLVEVAWADGRLDEKEKKALLHAARHLDSKRGPIDHALLECWTVHRPEPILFEAWRDYCGSLAAGLSAEERRLLRDEILGQARDVAAASGSLLGIGSAVSKSEQNVLEKLGRVFDAPGAK